MKWIQSHIYLVESEANDNLGVKESVVPVIVRFDLAEIAFYCMTNDEGDEISEKPQITFKSGESIVIDMDFYEFCILHDKYIKENTDTTV